MEAVVLTLNTRTTSGKPLRPLQTSPKVTHVTHFLIHIAAEYQVYSKQCHRTDCRANRYANMCACSAVCLGPVDDTIVSVAKKIVLLRNVLFILDFSISWVDMLI